MSRRTQREKLWLAGGVFVVLIMVAFSWLVVVSPELSTASNLRQQTTDAQTMNLMLQHQVSDLRAQSSQLPEVRAQMLAEQQALPSDSGIDTLTRQLTVVAASSHVKLDSVTASTPVPVSATGVTAPATPSAGPLDAAGRLFSVNVTVITDGRTRDQQTFLHEVQGGARAVLVRSAAFGSSTGSAVKTLDAATTMTLELRVFVAPKSPQAQAELSKQLGE